MSFYDVLLALHVFGAFALVGAITLFSILIVATWRAKRPSDVVGFAGIRRVGELLMVAGWSRPERRSSLRRSPAA